MFLDFPGGPVVKSLCFQLQEVWVPSLVGELNSQMPWGIFCFKDFLFQI